MKNLTLFLLLALLTQPVFADPDLGEPEPANPRPNPVEDPDSLPPRAEPNPAPAPAPRAPTGNPEVDLPPVACTAVSGRPFVYSCRVMSNWHVTHWDSARMIERNPFCTRISSGLYYCELSFENGTYN